jgi:LAO/AO transport system kinase
MVDFLLLKYLVLVMNAKKKRGIMEMADAIVINKADGDNIKSESSQTGFNRALHLFLPKSGWTLHCCLQCNY